MEITHSQAQQNISSFLSYIQLKSKILKSILKGIFSSLKVLTQSTFNHFAQQFK